jgi:YD repeat-containing protein
MSASPALRWVKAVAQPITVQDVSGISTRIWDAASRLTGFVNGLGQALTYSLDSMANRIFMIDCDGGRTTQSYDQQNRLTLILNPYGERTTIVWNNLGREWKKTLANGMIVSHVFDPLAGDSLFSGKPGQRHGRQPCLRPGRTGPGSL